MYLLNLLDIGSVLFWKLTGEKKKKSQDYRGRTPSSTYSSEVQLINSRTYFTLKNSITTDNLNIHSIILFIVNINRNYSAILASLPIVEILLKLFAGR
jgi:hypothetical protein